MKKIFLILALVISLVLAEKAIGFSEDEQKIIDTRVEKIQEDIDTKWENYRDFYLYLLDEEKQNTKDEKQKEIIDAIREKIQKVQEIESPTNLEEYHIDTKKILEIWLNWQNTVRWELKLTPYSYDSLLNNSALTWSQLSAKKSYIDHKRTLWDTYYNYKKIESWMKWEGVVCKNISRKTFSESIGYGSFSCNDEDCTDELISWIKSTFNFFMSEKGKKHSPHYNAIVSPYFSTIGTGIELVKTGKNTYKYYLTSHYCTELISN